MNLDVSNTAIECYSGCLTSSSLEITGASNTCHNGSIMTRFMIVVGVILGLVLVSAVGYRRVYLGCTGGGSSSESGSTQM